MNENDLKIRKQWLVMWILSMSISFITMLLRLLFDHTPNLPPAVHYLTGTISILAIGAFNYVAYRCIYKKPGTKLLTFSLIFSVITLPVTPILYLKGQIEPLPYIPYYGAFLFMTEVIGAVWIVVCWRMRKANKRLQALKA